MDYSDWALDRYYEQEALTEAMYEAGFEDQTEYLDYLEEKGTSYYEYE